MNETKLGKIHSVNFGFGGYQDAMIGFSFAIVGDGWGVGDFWGHWAGEPSKNAEWSKESRDAYLGKTVQRISQLLADAKKENLQQLKGVPVRVSFNGGMLSGWEVLKEVL